MVNHSSRASAYGPALVIFIGVMLRLIMLQVDVRFHPDEALFAAQARLISHDGDLLLRTTDLDKPPLTFYVTALSFRLLGPTERAARLPNVLFSSLSLLLLFLLVDTLYQDRRTATSAALLWALSPYDLAFAATAFTDIQATFWILAASLLAVRDRWRAAGIAAALALAAKTNVVVFLPLVVMLGLAQALETDGRRRDLIRRIGRFLWPLALGLGILAVWDASRAPRSFFRLGYERNNPGRLIRSDELWPRLEQWAHWLQFVAGSPLLSAALLIVILIWLGRGVYRRPPPSTFDGLIAGFALAFLSGYWLIAFNTYDRYLHPLVPFLMVLAARALTGWWSGRRTLWAAVPTGLTALLMIPAVITGLHGHSTLGGDQGKHTGIDTLADTLNTKFQGQIVYDHWLGWELAYYLGEQPQIALRYAALPEALADDVAQQLQPCYFVAPSPQEAAPWLDALRRKRISAAVAYSDAWHHFIVYRLNAESD